MATVQQRLSAGDSEVTQGYYGHLVAYGAAYLRERARLYAKERGDQVLGVAPKSLRSTERAVLRRLGEMFEGACAGRADIYVRVVQLASVVEGVPLTCLEGDPVYQRGLQEVT
jgi:hypothetical protein